LLVRRHFILVTFIKTDSKPEEEYRNSELNYTMVKELMITIYKIASESERTTWSDSHFRTDWSKG